MRATACDFTDPWLLLQNTNPLSLQTFSTLCTSFFKLVLYGVPQAQTPEEKKERRNLRTSWKTSPNKRNRRAGQHRNLAAVSTARWRHWRQLLLTNAKPFISPAFEIRASHQLLSVADCKTQMKDGPPCATARPCYRNYPFVCGTEHSDFFKHAFLEVFFFYLFYFISIITRQSVKSVQYSVSENIWRSSAHISRVCFLSFQRLYRSLAI